MRLWKLLGLAGLVGVAATGVVLARAERQRRAYSPQEIRERLHARHAAASDRTGVSEHAAPPGHSAASEPTVG